MKNTKLSLNEFSDTQKTLLQRIYSGYGATADFIRSCYGNSKGPNAAQKIGETWKALLATIPEGESYKTFEEGWLNSLQSSMRRHARRKFGCNLKGEKLENMAYNRSTRKYEKITPPASFESSDEVLETSIPSEEDGMEKREDAFLNAASLLIQKDEYTLENIVNLLKRRFK